MVSKEKAMEGAIRKLIVLRKKSNRIKNRSYLFIFVNSFLYKFLGITIRDIPLLV